MSTVAARIAKQTASRRGIDYDDEVRRLLDAARNVMKACGTESRPRVADIVTASGLSNEAFYRHFSSKDELVSAILEEGTERLRSYLAHRMSKETLPDRQIGRWVDGILTQAADPEIAAATLAVLWNAGSINPASSSGSPSTAQQLGALIERPLAELGSERPTFDATLRAHAVLGLLSEHLWRRTRPMPAEVKRVASFCANVGQVGVGIRT